MFRFISLCGAFFFLFLNCSNLSKSPTEPSSLMPGSFQLTQLSNGALSKQSSASNLNSLPKPFQIDLGSIKASRDFYFLLRNSGDFEIDSIKLSISGKGFSISPSEILVLKPENIRNGEPGFLPLLRVTVTHGEALDGIGWVGVLPKDSNQAQIAISGTTKNASGKDTSTSLVTLLSVNAKLMDMKVFADTSEILLDWEHACGNVGDRENGYWQHCFSKGPLRFLNTGNVPINYNFIIVKSNDSEITLDTTVQPDDTFHIDIMSFHPDSFTTIFMVAKSDNIVTDLFRLPLSTLGEARKQFVQTH